MLFVNGISYINIINVTDIVIIILFMAVDEKYNHLIDYMYF